MQRSWTYINGKMRMPKKEPITGETEGKTRKRNNRTTWCTSSSRILRLCCRRFQGHQRPPIHFSFHQAWVTNYQSRPFSTANWIGVTRLNFQHKWFQSKQHSHRLPLPRQTGPELHFLLLGSALVAPTVKNLPEMKKDPGSIPGLGIFPREGNGNPLQYSCLEISVDRGYSPWGHKESDTTEWLTLSYFM